MTASVIELQGAPVCGSGGSAVDVRRLTRRFGHGAPVLDELDLHLRAGEFVALLGHSGSGKSTLLRMLAGLDALTEGEIERPEAVSVVFQESRLLPWKRVWENVALGQTGGQARERALAVIEEVGLGHRIDAWPLTLSGGEAQRVALARALVREPGLLLLDEPFAALDALTRMRMQGLVEALWKQHGCAVLLVTHDVDEALTIADRAVVLDRGRISTDLAIDLPRPRRFASPERERLRRHLLDALHVTEHV